MERPLAPPSALGDFTGVVDAEVAAEDEAENGDLEERSGGLADASAEGGGKEGAGKAEGGGAEFTNGGAEGGPFELEVTDFEAVGGPESVVDKFENEIEKGEAEVGAVEGVEDDKHEDRGEEEKEKEFVSVAKMGAVVKTAFADVDHGGGGDGFGSVPLSVGNERNKGKRGGKFGAVADGVAEAEKED